MVELLSWCMCISKNGANICYSFDLMASIPASYKIDTPKLYNDAMENFIRFIQKVCRLQMANNIIPCH